MAPRFDVRVELKLAGEWVDITGDVRVADGGIQITRGRRDESGAADPTSCTLEVNNRDGRYSIRNPASPYYGLIGRNTPLRVSVDGHVRFAGEVAAWPVRWDVTGNDVWVPIEAAGILRRLGQGDRLLLSPLRRALEHDPDVIAYWPLEDAEGSTSMASGLSNGGSMRIVGVPNFAASDVIAGSAPLPTVGKAAFSGPVLDHEVTGVYLLRFLVIVPEDGTSTQRLISLHGSGSVARWDLRYQAQFGGEVVLRAYDDEDSLLDESPPQFELNGNPMLMKLTLSQSGPDVEWQIFNTDAITGEPITGLAGEFAGQTIGTITGVTVAGFRNLGDVAFGHVVLSNAAEPFPPSEQLVKPMLGWNGELAGRRIQRLCEESGVPFEPVGDMSNTPPMGVQGRESLLTLLQECAEVDGGMLLEMRDDVGLMYRTAGSMYNQE